MIKQKMTARISLGWIYLLLLLILSQRGLSQRRDANIGVGSLNINLDECIAGDNVFLQYPREFEVYRSQDCARGEGFIIATKDFPAKAYYEDGHANPQKPNNGWVVGETTLDYIVVDGTPTLMLDIDHTSVPVSGEFRKYWKYEPPTVIVNGENLTAGDWHADYEEVKATIPTEQMGFTHLQTSIGVDIFESVYTFGNPDYDDFALVEYEFKYTGETPNVDDNGDPITYTESIDSCYIGIKFFPVIYERDVVPHAGGWTENTDDWVEYVYAEDIDGDSDTLRVMYGWDGDASVVDADDEGDPLVTSSGVFLSPQYPGVAVLHVDRAGDDPSNDMHQPHLTHVSYGGVNTHNALTSGQANAGIGGIQGVYDKLVAGGELIPALDWTNWKQNHTNQWPRGTQYPNDNCSQIGTMAFGPYDFELGKSIRILVCYTVGTISWKEAIDLGAQWKAGSISPTEKNLVLRSGRDSLFSKIKAVQGLYANTGYNIEEFAQQIPSPPAWPDSVVLSSEVGGCKVEWSEVEGAVAYRVYRRLKSQFYIVTPGTETYPLVFQCGGEAPGANAEYSSEIVTSWVDRNVVPAHYYWYYVTAINADGVESSHFVTRINPTNSDPSRGGVTPFEKPPVGVDSIYVVPNPYHVKAVRLYPGQVLDQLNFVGLPAACRIRIFTQAGDLVAKIDHKLKFPPSSTEAWELRTSMNQTVASGLYVYVVDKCRDHNNQPINETKVGKFVVIR